MHLGVFMECDYRTGVTEEEALDEAFSLVKLAEEKGLDGVWLAETIAALLGDASHLARMSEAARGLAHPNAARDIAVMVARVAGREES